MNKSIMMGRLVRDPEINYTTKKDGDEFVVANFRIAVDRKYSDETDFFPCTAFGWLAEPFMMILARLNTLAYFSEAVLES